LSSDLTAFVVIELPHAVYCVGFFAQSKTFQAAISLLKKRSKHRKIKGLTYYTLLDFMPLR